MGLTMQSYALWAKLCRRGTGRWLSLPVHMADSAETARLLWEEWAPRGVRDIIKDSTQKPLELFVFLAAAHDLGKATPSFQLAKPDQSESMQLAKRRVLGMGFTCGKLTNPGRILHAAASYRIATREGLKSGLAVVLGGHHGKPLESGTANNLSSFPKHIGENDQSWLSVQKELLGYAAELSGVSLETWKQTVLTVPAQMVLSGLVIMTDWIASNEDLFPHLEDETQSPLKGSTERARNAWRSLGLTQRWKMLDEERLKRYDIYADRFEKIKMPRPIQTAMTETVFELKEPGIIVLEAPMGEGKTEAALAVAEILASKTGRSGVFFALPTQATSDGIFPRMLNWIRRLCEKDEVHSIQLAHGKAGLNDQYKGLRSPLSSDPDNIIVHEWFSGRKKGLLADFVVGTVDQILMTGLKQKHLAMRHLALANKVLIIDECHAYDAYMNSYLYKALNWLGAYQTPVIILSATLPPATREKLVAAYLDKNFVRHGLPAALESGDAYPRITFTDGEKVLVKNAEPSGDRELKVLIKGLNEEDLVGLLEEKLCGGGCAGVIVNTVGRAQEIARLLSGRFGEETVKILHSRMIACDRINRESELRNQLDRDSTQRPYKLIVVGTQVIEQSLDLDFDLLITDICPMDLLLQRMGRLHRHERERPKRLRQAICRVMGAVAEEEFDDGSVWVYGAYMLMRTKALLEGRGIIALPDDIPGLVRKAYSDEELGLHGEEYLKAQEKDEEKRRKKEGNARNFQIKKPADFKNTLTDLLNTSVDEDKSGKRAEAAVRDTGDSVEVLVIQRRQDGSLWTLPFAARRGDERIPSETPNEELARIIAACSVRLPQVLSGPWQIDKTIAAFEKNNRDLPKTWQESHWLKDELFLTLDEDFCAEIAGWRITYDEKYGLLTEKAGGEHGGEV